MYINQELDFLVDNIEEKNIVEMPEIVFENPTENNLIPRVGLYLGLDISETSTGVCLYENGEKVSANIYLETPADIDFREVRLRRELKKDLSELIVGKSFNLIIIEDAFQGVNPSTTRLLYALNTAIDELILDGVCKCEKFLRVSNKTWKSWLFTIDSEGIFKGLKDKIKIEKCLELLGVHDSGEGYQDRLDSCGMLLGYFLCKDKIKEKSNKKRVAFEDIDFDYQEDIDLAVMNIKAEVGGISIGFVDEPSWSKKKMVDYLTENPSKVLVTKDLVRLGFFADKLGLPYFEDGAYFAFWVKPKKLKKYVKE